KLRNGFSKAKLYVDWIAQAESTIPALLSHRMFSKGLFNTAIVRYMQQVYKWTPLRWNPARMGVAAWRDEISPEAVTYPQQNPGYKLGARRFSLRARGRVPVSSGRFYRLGRKRVQFRRLECLNGAWRRSSQGLVLTVLFL